MAIVKKNAKAGEKAAPKQEEKKNKKAAAATEKTEKAASKKAAPVKTEVEGKESLVAEDYTYTVKLDSKKYFGRNTEQVEALAFGALGAVKKILIEKEVPGEEDEVE